MINQQFSTIITIMKTFEQSKHGTISFLKLVLATVLVCN